MQSPDLFYNVKHGKNRISFMTVATTKADLQLKIGAIEGGKKNLHSQHCRKWME
jgi:hypothetical protein